MATNLALDDRLIAEAVRVSGHTTKKAAVTHALTEYIPRRNASTNAACAAFRDRTPIT